MAALAGADPIATSCLKLLPQLPIEILRHLGRRRSRLLDDVNLHRLAGRDEAVDLGHLLPNLSGARFELSKRRCLGGKGKLVVAAPPDRSFRVPSRYNVKPLHVKLRAAPSCKSIRSWLGCGTVKVNSKKLNRPPQPAGLGLAVAADDDVEGEGALHRQCAGRVQGCLLYTSPSPRDRQKSRMPSSA